MFQLARVRTSQVLDRAGPRTHQTSLIFCTGADPCMACFEKFLPRVGQSSFTGLDFADDVSHVVSVYRLMCIPSGVLARAFRDNCQWTMLDFSVTTSALFQVRFSFFYRLL